MKLEYKNVGTYNEWASALWNTGYSVPITDIPDLIGVSLSWIKRVLLKNINYVVYDSKWVYERTKKTCLSYIRLPDLSKYIQEQGQFMVQTEIIDLAYVLESHKKEYREAMALYKKCMESYKTRGYTLGTVPSPVLKYLVNNLYIINAYRNYSCKERNRVPWVDLEPFDIFAQSDRIYFIGDSTHSKDVVETIYRTAFLKGDIKIKLGTITIFYEARQQTDKMKMPYLIPYGKEVRVI